MENENNFLKKEKEKTPSEKVENLLQEIASSNQDCNEDKIDEIYNIVDKNKHKIPQKRKIK